MAPEQLEHKLDIDVTDETAFKVGVVQTLQLIVDRTSGLKDIAEKVEKHDRIVDYGKWTAIPLLTLFHVSIKAALHKLGWS